MLQILDIKCKSFHHPAKAGYGWVKHSTADPRRGLENVLLDCKWTVTQADSIVYADQVDPPHRSGCDLRGRSLTLGAV